MSSTHHPWRLDEHGAPVVDLGALDLDALESEARRLWRLSAHLFAAGRTGRPLVVEVSEGDLAPGAPLPVLLALAHAALPHRLASRCRLLVAERLPPRLPVHEGTWLLAAGGVLPEPPPELHAATVLRSDGGLARGPDVDPAVDALMREVVQLVLTDTRPLRSFGLELDHLLGAGLSPDRQLVESGLLDLSYNVALAWQTGRWDDLFTEVLLPFARTGEWTTVRPWRRLLPMGHPAWRGVSLPTLGRIALGQLLDAEATVLPPAQARSLSCLCGLVGVGARQHPQLQGEITDETPPPVWVPTLRQWLTDIDQPTEALIVGDLGEHGRCLPAVHALLELEGLWAFMSWAESHELLDNDTRRRVATEWFVAKRQRDEPPADLAEWRRVLALLDSPGELTDGSKRTAILTYPQVQHLLRHDPEQPWPWLPGEEEAQVADLVSRAYDLAAFHLVVRADARRLDLDLPADVSALLLRRAADLRPELALPDPARHGVLLEAFDVEILSAAGGPAAWRAQLPQESRDVQAVGRVLGAAGALRSLAARALGPLLVPTLLVQPERWGPFVDSLKLWEVADFVDAVEAAAKERALARRPVPAPVRERLEAARRGLERVSARGVGLTPMPPGEDDEATGISERTAAYFERCTGALSQPPEQGRPLWEVMTRRLSRLGPDQVHPLVDWVRYLEQLSPRRRRNTRHPRLLRGLVQVLDAHPRLAAPHGGELPVLRMLLALAPSPASAVVSLFASRATRYDREQSEAWWLALAGELARLDAWGIQDALRALELPSIHSLLEGRGIASAQLHRVRALLEDQVRVMRGEAVPAGEVSQAEQLSEELVSEELERTRLFDE